MKHAPFLWPDHTIGKRESRAIREQHNALYNSHAVLLAACVEALDCATRAGGDVMARAESVKNNLQAAIKQAEDA